MTIETKQKYVGKRTEVIELLERSPIDGELSLTLSLYRVNLECRCFYLVSSASESMEAAEMLGSDPEEAFEIYRRLVRGTVPPSTLREIVFDLMDSPKPLALH